MGACSSVHKAKTYAVSPHRQKPVMNGDENTAAQMVGSVFSLKTTEHGSKDESFFDSRAWLDSDCDDDFFSVNGDFTPSRGTTPNNQTISISTTVAPRTFSFDRFPDNKSEPSPIARKKLSDLFQEQEAPRPNGSIEKLQTEIPTVDKDREAKYRKKGGGAKAAAQCCLPSFSERSQNMSPVQ